MQILGIGRLAHKKKLTQNHNDQKYELFTPK